MLSRSKTVLYIVDEMLTVDEINFETHCFPDTDPTYPSFVPDSVVVLG